MTAPVGREVRFTPDQTALLFIDVQNYAAHRRGGEFKALSDAKFAERYGYFFHELRSRTLPNMQRLQAACRAVRVEVLYTVIESLTLDGRDCSLDFKRSGLNVPKGSWDGKVLAELAPEGDELVLPKSSTSVFISTSLDYILRNLGVTRLIVSGLLTDQCVESAVRDACDLGYLVTLVTDACATYTPEQHEHALQAMSGFCRQRTTEQVLAELASAQEKRRRARTRRPTSAEAGGRQGLHATTAS
ncbi:MAG TPA: isochorismatase family cysteine hydrolase [Ktedonobacterales bacterium]|jgi:ureidoacrylate peracid hydrolase|nr:isochorismatase family cysteine hydrolase [Ktedonobacterales bacterium]